MSAIPATPARPLKVGLALPQFEHSMDGATPRWADICAIAQRAEAIGCDSVWIVDHFLFQFGGEPRPTGIWECWSLLAALAASTSRVELGTLVLGMGFRNPALLAKMADTVDEISGGRLILGLGAGYHALEYRAFGYPPDHRYSRFAEALQITHGLLRHGSVDFEGTYYSARECELRPRGPRPNGPPILIGTIGEKMLRLTARYAEQWNAFYDDTRNSVAGLEGLRGLVDAACAAEGRDPATLQRTATVLATPPGRAVDLSASALHYGLAPLSGTAEEQAAELRRYAAAGVTHVQVWLDQKSLAGVEAFAPVLEALDRG
jgi:alkanesulfonate monooxygenase SsuD/methylene tetrahydromethanopterin reductase-like flavin-dependent oxidoreductase (luciferase family)